MTLFAGIDIGTSGVRCGVFDWSGARVGFAARPLDHGPAVAMTDLDARATLEAVCAATREAAMAAPGAIQAVGITSQRTGFVLIDGAGEPLVALRNADGRAATQGAALDREHGERIYSITGRLPSLLFLPARLAWLRETRPAVIEAARGALSIGDWVARALTGASATDRTQAAEMGCLDVARVAWSEEIADLGQVPRAALPPIAEPGCAVGLLTEEAAGRTGLPVGTAIVGAGTDSQCAALALGAVESGDSTLVAGTTLIAARVLDRPADDALARTWLSPHLFPDRWVREVHGGEAGSALTWVAGLMGLDPAALVAEAASGEPGAGGIRFIDPFPGNVSDFPALRRGSIDFPAPVLAVGRPRADVARSVVEGLAFGGAASLGWLDESWGPPRRTFVTGGVARSEVFLTALSGALGVPAIAPTDDAGATRGAAVVAASGHHGSLAEAARAMAAPVRVVAPSDGDPYAAIWHEWLAHARERETHTVGMKGLFG